VSERHIAPASIQCQGKKAFDTFAEAHRTAKRLTATSAYRCPHCHKFHIGHALKPVRRPAFAD
jgi:hypothetical protein